MSLNAALNATVALIEGRIGTARDLLRSPGSDVKNVPDILARLDRAVSKVSAQAIRSALMQTLAVHPMQRLHGMTDAEWKIYEEAFYTGVAMVEKVMENAAEALEHRTGD